MAAQVELSLTRRESDRPARVQAYVALREAIVAMELVPGVRLSENELAARLGLSRTPVREALARLRDEGLVYVVPQLGTYVAPISLQAVHDVQFVREALECAAVRLAAEKAGSEDVALLRANLEAQSRAEAAGDYDAFYVLDEALHDRLCVLSGHAIAATITQRAKVHLNRVRRLALPVPDYVRQMVDEHREIVAAVAAADPDDAERAMRHHLRMVLSALPRIRGEHPELFDDDGAGAAG
jgi:GntR family transcriptional regulator, rspAB operon transcriptional repressor